MQINFQFQFTRFLIDFPVCVRSVFYLTRTYRWMKNCLLLSRGYMPTPFTSQSSFDSIDFNWIWLNHSHFSLVITQLWKMGSSSDVTQTTFNSIQLCSFLFNYQLFSSLSFIFLFFSLNEKKWWGFCSKNSFSIEMNYFRSKTNYFKKVFDNWFKFRVFDYIHIAPILFRHIISIFFSYIHIT